MAKHQGGIGSPMDRDINLHIEDPEVTGMNNDNDSISGLDATVALGGLKAEDNPSELLPSNQTKLTALTWENIEQHQWVDAGERQPAENELLNLSLVLQPPPSPAPTEPLREVICQYTNTLCTTQKQTNLTNSLLQDITLFNEYDSTKQEDRLTDIETAADLRNKKVNLNLQKPNQED